ncbi:MAG TPA: hypothetical protein VK607_09060, partial [Kofleriaceae bacterium]|nr:hypothetical protein [Kofleriaceae bacterium]
MIRARSPAHGCCARGHIACTPGAPRRNPCRHLAPVIKRDQINGDGFPLDAFFVDFTLPFT